MRSLRPLPILKRNKPKEIIALVKHEKREKALKAKLERYHAYDISEAMQGLTPEERKRLCLFLSIEKLSKAIAQISEETAAKFIMELDKTLAAKVLTFMENDDAVDILQHLKHEDSLAFMVLLEDEKRDSLRELSRYKHLTAGSEMNTNYIRLNPAMDVKEAMKILVKQADSVEVIDTMFVLDEQEKLLGIVDLKDLIVAKHPKTIDKIMQTNYYAVNVNDGIQEVVKDIQKYDTTAMPVLDDDMTIEGILTMNDAMDIIEEEASDDYQKLAGLYSDSDIHDTPKTIVKKRLPWLTLLLLMNIIIATVIASFEATIATITALVLFQPLIMDMAGNIGTQSLAVTILKISKKTLKSRINVTTHLLQEVSIGLINGLLLGSMAFLTAWGFLSMIPIGIVGDQIAAITVASVVGLSVFSALVVSAFLGSVIPLILNVLKIDPAVASGPFVTTINDVVALFVYFGLATALILNVL